MATRTTPLWKKGAVIVNYTIINGEDELLTDVNAGGVDVDPFSYKDGVTLTNTELATLLGTPNPGTTPQRTRAVAVVPDLTGHAQATQFKRAVALAGLYVST